MKGARIKKEDDDWWFFWNDLRQFKLPENVNNRTLKLLVVAFECGVSEGKYMGREDALASVRELLDDVI
jgi:hypothetical protein